MVENFILKFSLDNRTSDHDQTQLLVGIFLHAMVPTPLAFSLGASTIPIILSTIDPMYFVFLPVTFLSPLSKLFLRIVTTFLFILHGCVLVFTFVICLTYATLPIHVCLKSMTNPKLFHGPVINSNPTPDLNPSQNLIDFATISQSCAAFVKFERIGRFPKYFLKYRQLQILNTTYNQLTTYILPISLLISLVTCSVVGYIWIKLSFRVPLTITLMAMVVIIILFGAAHFLFPLGSNMTLKSEMFLKFWKLQFFSSCRKRQIKSCRPLQVSIGDFYYVVKSSRTHFISLMLYYTITLVISL